MYHRFKCSDSILWCHILTYSHAQKCSSYDWWNFDEYSNICHLFCNELGKSCISLCKSWSCILYGPWFLWGGFTLWINHIGVRNGMFICGFIKYPSNLCHYLANFVWFLIRIFWKQWDQIDSRKVFKYPNGWFLCNYYWSNDHSYGFYDIIFEKIVDDNVGIER